VIGTESRRRWDGAFISLSDEILLPTYDAFLVTVGRTLPRPSHSPGSGRTHRRVECSGATSTRFHPHLSLIRSR